MRIVAGTVVVGALVACAPTSPPRRAPAPAPVAALAPARVRVARIDIRAGEVSRTALERELSGVAQHTRDCFATPPPPHVVVHLEWADRGFVESSGGGGGHLVDRHDTLELGTLTFPGTQPDVLPDVEECFGVVFAHVPDAVKAPLAIDLELDYAP